MALDISEGRMGTTHSRNGQKHGKRGMKAPVNDLHLAERQEESSYGDGNGHWFYKLRKDLDVHGEHYSSSEMVAKLRWSKVKSLLVKHKRSFKTTHASSRKSSSRILEEEFLPGTIKNTWEVLCLMEADRRKYVDRSSSSHTVNVKDVEQLPKWEWRAPARGEDKVVLYFTSLRGIRKTFDDCCAVKLILGGLQVLVDERDIAMHAPFRQELKDLLGTPIKVPSLFIAGKYIGGIEEIQLLHDAGELAKYLEGFPLHTSSTGPCHGCGDARFVPCLNCDGSRKIFTQEKDNQPRPQGLFVRCLQCNENGLIICPLCSCW